MTPLPVLGVPVASRRRCPARTACSRSCRCRPAFRSARWPSARPAPPMRACSPPQILALADEELATRLDGFRASADGVGCRGTEGRCLTCRRDRCRPARPSASSAAASSAACWPLAAARLGFRLPRLLPTTAAPPSTSATRTHHRRLRRPRARSPRFAGAVDVVTYEFENVPVDAAAASPARSCRCGRAPRRSRSRRTGCARSTSSRGSASPVAPFARDRRPGRARRRASRDARRARPS